MVLEFPGVGFHHDSMRYQTFIGGLALASLPRTLATDAAPTPHTQFHSSGLRAGLRYVRDSGVCETTPGVHTASGYIDVAQNQSLVSVCARVPVCAAEACGGGCAVVLVLCGARAPGDGAVHAVVRPPPARLGDAR